MTDKEIRKLSNLVKELETKIDNNKFDQDDLNRKQSVFNVGMNNNLNALGRKVFPEHYEDEGKESGIITP
jgi:chitinase